MKNIYKKIFFSEISNQQRKYTQPVPHENEHSSFFPTRLNVPLILTAPVVTTYT